MASKLRSLPHVATTICDAPPPLVPMITRDDRILQEDSVPYEMGNVRENQEMKVDMIMWRIIASRTINVGPHVSQSPRREVNGLQAKNVPGGLDCVCAAGKLVAHPCQRESERADVGTVGSLSAK